MDGRIYPLPFTLPGLVIAKVHECPNDVSRTYLPCQHKTTMCRLSSNAHVFPIKTFICAYNNIQLLKPTQENFKRELAQPARLALNSWP